MEAARGVWESLIKICGGMLEAWQGYINMELLAGNINEARAIYRKLFLLKLVFIQIAFC